MKKQQSAEASRFEPFAASEQKKVYSIPKLAILGKVEELTTVVELGTECDAIYSANSTGFPCPS